jgi:FkbM family methyltransferase
LLDRSRAKRTLHLLGVYLFTRLLRLTGSPVQFRIGPGCCIAVDGVLLEYDIGRTGDVLGMDVDGPWEKNDVAFVVDQLRSGGTFYDIGANIGWYSLNVALKTRANVICFEPQPARLYQNLRLNRVEPTVVEVALGSEEGSVSMTSEHKAANFVSSTGTVRVPLTTIDHLVFESNLSPPTLIKMDVEGYEYFVLRGAQRTLKTYHPIVLCEVNGLAESRFGVPDRTLLDLLRDCGYERRGSNCANWVFTSSGGGVPVAAEGAAA